MIAFENGAGPVVELTIASAGDALEFDGASFTVTAGDRVELTLDNNSALNQHNWVLVNDGTKDDVSQRGSSYADDGWLEPGDPDVIAFTPLLDTETVGSVGFVAPSRRHIPVRLHLPGPQRDHVRHFRGYRLEPTVNQPFLCTDRLCSGLQRRGGSDRMKAGSHPLFG